MNPDVVTESVLAYTDHAREYAAHNANLMQREVGRFADLLPPGASVLDAGCGPGRDLASFADLGLEVVGVDLNPAFVKMASRFGQAHIADLRELPFAPASFDGVWACASLVHLPEEGAHEALLEFHRVSKSGSQLYVSVKTDGESGWRETSHGRRWFKAWSAGGFASLVEGAGFAVQSAEQGSAFVDVWATS